MDNFLIKAVIRRDSSAVLGHLKKTEMAAAMPDCQGWTAVHHAAHRGYEDILQLLLNHYSPSIRKELVNRVSHSSETPLMLACSKSGALSNDVVQILLLNGCNGDAVNFDSCSAAAICCTKQGRPNEVIRVLRTLLDMGCNFVDIPGSVSPLYNAIYYRLEECVMKFLVEKVKWTHTSVVILGNRLLHHDICPTSPYVVCLFFNFRISDCFLLMENFNYESLENMQILMRGLNSGFIDYALVLLIFIYMNKQSISRTMQSEIFMSILQEASAKRINITIPDDAVLEKTVCNVAVDSLVAAPTFEHELFRLFPESRATGSLQSICRVAVRAWLTDRHSSAWEAYNWLNKSSLPMAIKKFLLYEIDCPVIDPRFLKMYALVGIEAVTIMMKTRMPSI